MTDFMENLLESYFSQHSLNLIGQQSTPSMSMLFQEVTIPTGGSKSIQTG